MIEWPGRAGELAKAGRAKELRAELDGRYDLYHEHLQKLNARRDSLPDPGELRETMSDLDALNVFMDAATEWQHLIAGEHELREAHAAETTKQEPNTAGFQKAMIDAPSVPLADAQQQLRHRDDPDGRVPGEAPDTDSPPGNLPHEILKRHRP